MTTRSSQALLGVLLIVGGAVVGWSLSRGTSNARDPEGLAGEVAVLRQLVEEQADRLARLERDRAALGSRGAEGPADAGPELHGRKDASGRVTTPPPAPAERGRQVLEDLKQNVDGSRVVAIRAALTDFVRIGDPIVPDIAAVLDSGLEKRYIDRKLMLQHVRGYVGLRQVLMNALREIGTPNAKAALLAAVARSQNLRDYRDLVCPYEGSTDTAFVEQISALVPGMLRRLAETGIQKDDYEAEELASCLARWIDKHELTDALDEVEAVLLHTTSRHAYIGINGLFRVLVKYAPERGARVVIALKKRKEGSLWMFTSSGVSQVPRTALARFYRVLVARESEPNGRSSLYHGIPGGVLGSIEDPDERVADAEALVAFLEGRLGAETAGNPKYALQLKLESLRKSIAAVKDSEAR